MSDAQRIKLYVQGESFWAKDLGDGKAEINNLPLEEGLFYQDVVAYDAGGNVLEVLERKWRYKALVDYAPTDPETAKVVAKFFRDGGYPVEGFVPGLLAVQFQKMVKLPKLEGIRVSYFGITEQKYGGEGG